MPTKDSRRQCCLGYEPFSEMPTFKIDLYSKIFCRCRHTRKEVAKNISSAPEYYATQFRVKATCVVDRQSHYICARIVLENNGSHLTWSVIICCYKFSVVIRDRRRIAGLLPFHPTMPINERINCHDFNYNEHHFSIDPHLYPFACLLAAFLLLLPLLPLLPSVSPCPPPPILSPFAAAHSISATSCMSFGVIVLPPIVHSADVCLFLWEVSFCLSFLSLSVVPSVSVCMYLFPFLSLSSPFFLNFLCIVLCRSACFFPAICLSSIMCQRLVINPSGDRKCPAATLPGKVNRSPSEERGRRRRGNAGQRSRAGKKTERKDLVSVGPPWNWHNQLRSIDDD